MNRQALLDLLAEYPVIPAIKNESGLHRCLESDSPLVFILHATLNTVSGLVDTLKAHGKTVFVHIDLIDGLSQKEEAVEFLAKNTHVDGIISTRPNLIRHAASLSLLTVQRYFLLDSKSLHNVVKSCATESADLVEVLPGLMPKIIHQLSSIMPVPLVAGGLISDKEDAIAALSAGAAAISTTCESVWFL